MDFLQLSKNIILELFLRKHCKYCTEFLDTPHLMVTMNQYGHIDIKICSSFRLHYFLSDSHFLLSCPTWGNTLALDGTSLQVSPDCDSFSDVSCL
jgi:hypothetical protein